MHCQTEAPIPLKDTSSQTVRQSLMDFPEIVKQKSHRPQESEKKLHGNIDEAIVAHENDILLGRGGKNNMHTGNEKLRELAREVAQQYHRSSKKEKSYLSRTLVQKVKEMDPPGRFLRKHTKENQWEDMSDDEDKCREKCAQVIRDAVAFVGLKDPPPPSMAQREQQLQQNHNPFSMRRTQMTMHPLLQQQQQQQSLQMNSNPFAMSASTSSQIMNHQQQLLAAGRQQFSLPGFNQPQVTRNSLPPAGRTFEPLSLSTGFPTMPAPVPQSMQMRPMTALHGDGGFRAPKRRRMSNSFFNPFAALPGESASFGVDRRFSMASNSFPAVSDFPNTAPGLRVNPRRDSLFGSFSLGAHGSDHSGASFGDFQLFPDITEAADAAEGSDDCGATTKNDNDEFATDFY